MRARGTVSDLANLSLHFPANSFETLIDDETPATSAADCARMGGERLFSAIGGAETGSISPC
jgi:hypothetical protein